MKIPTEEELAGSKPYCLDTEWMLKNFLGKSKSEAIEMIKSNGLVSEDYSYMAATGLVYYLTAAFEYLQSDDVEEDVWDFPKGLLLSLMSQVKYSKVDSSAIPLILEVKNYCKNHITKLGIDVNCSLYQGYIEGIEEAEQAAPSNR